MFMSVNGVSTILHGAWSSQAAHLSHAKHYLIVDS